MAKNKKKSKKNKSLYKSIKPFVKDNRVLLSILGAAGAGVALAAAFGTDNVKQWVDKISTAVSGQSGAEDRTVKTNRTSKIATTA